MVVTGMPQDKKGIARSFAGDKLAVLRKHPIFCDLDPEALDQLCRYAKPPPWKRGATIFFKGRSRQQPDCGHSSGTREDQHLLRRWPQRDFESHRTGRDFRGSGGARRAGADGRCTANTNCEIYVIDRRDFIPFVRSQPALAMKFIELLCTRLRWTSDQVEQVILQNLPGRLASALIRLTEKHKLEPTGRTIAITQQEISEMVGMTRKRQQAVAGLGRPQMGSSRTRGHRRAGCRAAAGADRGRNRRRLAR